MESFSDSKKKGVELVKSTEKWLYGKVFQELKTDFEQGGFKAVGEHLLQSVSIYPDFVAKKEHLREFIFNRDTLNTRSGIIIANHPGFYENFIIFSTLEREDVLIVTSSETYDRLSPVFGTEHILSVPDGITEGKEFLEKIKTHIISGGVVLIYPSGGNELEGSGFAFQSGFEKILRNCLTPEDMVYTFYIDAQNAHSSAHSRMRRYKGASAILSHDFIDLNADAAPIGVAVHEQFTTASQWLAVMDAVAKQDRSMALTKYYTRVVGTAT